jgi:hypothetical protein
LSPRFVGPEEEWGRGDAAPGGPLSAFGKVKVDVAYKAGKVTRKKALSLTIKNGRFSGTLKLSAADAKNASKLTVTVTYPGATPIKKTVSIKK